MLKRLNKVLPELVLELLIYGCMIQIIGMWFVENKIFYSIGLWMGIGIAIGMAVHMAIVIEDAVSMEINGGGNQKRIMAKSALRYIVVAILFFIITIFHVGNSITCFIGVMGLKASAYMQPFTHRCILKLRGIKKARLDAE